LAVADRFIREGIARADLSAFDATVADDVTVITGLSPGAPIEGRAAYKAVFRGFAEAWPVREFTVHRMVEAGSSVVVEFTAVAEFAREYYGVAPTHQLVPMREMHWLEIRDGWIVRNTVGAINLPFEFLMYPVLKDLVLGGLVSAH
jgi:ketosteroid isomerase-like protein